MIIYFTVTNDLNFDQRMIRICTSLSQHGYQVVLVGRSRKNSKLLTEHTYQQQRLRCFFERGKLFYVEFNIRLFIFLLFKKMDIICAIDLDTILPCYFISILKKKKRVYDAHELFCEMKEIVTRPGVYKIWKKIEQFAVPKFIQGYTVNHLIAEEFKKMYAINYTVIRSIAIKHLVEIPVKKEKYLLYQGAVNEGRGFEFLIPAMAGINCNLVICGDGNFFEKANDLVNAYQLTDKIVFRGMILPADLKLITLHAHIGITLFEDNGLSNYLSLANRFFDYMHAAVPQVCMNFPLYQEINDDFKIAELIGDLNVATIQKAINKLLNDETAYYTLQQNCLKAREKYNWQNEEINLINFYRRTFE